MRAVVAPGAGTDIAPGWMLSEATAFSKAEHQRSERVNAETRRRRDTKGKGKGDGPGKGDRGKGEVLPRPRQSDRQEGLGRCRRSRSGSPKIFPSRCPRS